MSDLIDRDIAITTIKTECRYSSIDKDEVIDLLNDLPTARFERKTGKWIKPTGMMPPEYHGHYECSECGAWAGRPWYKPWSGVVLSRYCPECGIKMENANEE